MSGETLSVPYNFYPYPHQEDFFEWAVPEIFGGQAPEAATYASLAWARRHGKDLTAWNALICRALIRTGQYVYLLPTQKHAKKVVWEGIDNEGRRFMDYLPEAVVKRVSNVELTVELVNGSIIFLLGAENYDSIVGMNAMGLLLSEYSLIPRKAFEYFEPMILANKGFAWFVQTFRGTNHAWEMWNYVKDKMESGSPYHYANMVTAEQPDSGEVRDYCDRHSAIAGQRHDGLPIFSLKDIEHLQERGADEDKIASEYYCDPMAAQSEYYHMAAMEMVKDRGQITTVPWNTAMPVMTFWDIGKDGTAIIFAQIGESGTPRIIDFMGGLNRTLNSWLPEVEAKPYRVALDVLPHDAEQEGPNGQTMQDIFENEHNRRTLVVPRTDKKLAIQATDDIIPSCLFDKLSTVDLRDALRAYRRKWDEENEAYSKTPVHDWASHPADAMQQLALSWEDVLHYVKMLVKSTDGKVITKYRSAR